jgi:S1-C subfamily serine protease
MDHNVLLPTVFEVFPESVAEFAGIQVGDQISKLNDFETPTVQSLHQSLSYVRPQVDIFFRFFF